MCAQKANHTLGCSMARKWKKILRLCLSLVRPPPAVLCQALESLVQERYRPVRAALKESQKLFRELENFLYEESLRQLELFSLEKSLRRPYYNLPEFKRGL